MLKKTIFDTLLFGLLFCTGCQKQTLSMQTLQMIETTQPSDATPQLNAFQQAILDKHNQLRSNHFTDAPLSYSLELEDVAQNHANELAQMGTLDHDSNNKIYGYGENLYAFSRNAKPNLPTIIQKWYNEGIYYNYETQQCQKFKSCGHYTQIIWKTTKRIGCANAQYQKGKFKNGYITVCKYYPFGNIVGQDPY